MNAPLYSLNFLLLFFFIVGVSVGSFLNVLIDRIPRGETFTKGRSHCDSCKHVLVWYDLIPVLSFVSLKGKCRYCKKSIGIQAIALELLTGILFMLVAYQSFLEPISFVNQIITLLYCLFIMSCFIVIAYIDAKHGIIPNKLVYPATIVALLYQLVLYQTALPYFLSAFGAAVFFLLLFVITKGRGMGFGDVKLAFLLGLFLGFPNIIIALYLAFLTGAVIAFILVIRKKKKFSGGTIAFGPFLIFGSIVAFFFGNFLWNHLILHIW